MATATVTAADLRIVLTGAEYEPTGPAWDRATEAERRAYWRRLAEIAYFVKRQEIARGIGADGKKLPPVKPSSRPDGAKGPPLDPHHGESRTARLLAYSSTATGATLYWRAAGRKSWAVILGYHARVGGEVRGAPLRDTLGISSRGRKQVAAQARQWWATGRGTGARGAAEAARQAAAARVAEVAARAKAEAARVAREAAARAQAEAAAQRDAQAEAKARREEKARAQAEAAGAARAAQEAERLRKAEEKARKATEKEAREAARQAKRVAEAERIDAELRRKAAEAISKVESEAAAAAQAALGATGGLRARVQAAIAQTGGGPTSNVAVTEVIRQAQSATAVREKVAGMDREEEFHHLDFEGIRYHFPKVGPMDPTRPWDTHPFVSTLRRLLAFGPLPDALTKHTKDIHFSTQSNKDDDYWRKEFGNPNHKSAATGGQGRIVIYNGAIAGVDTLTHEMGHNLASGTWGSVSPRSVDFARARDSGEPEVSDYGKNNAAEDFAESVRLYVTNPAEMRRVAPRRYAALEDLIGPPSDG